MTTPSKGSGATEASREAQGSRPSVSAIAREARKKLAKDYHLSAHYDAHEVDVIILSATDKAWNQGWEEGVRQTGVVAKTIGKSEEHARLKSRAAQPQESLSEAIAAQIPEQDAFSQFIEKEMPKPWSEDRMIVARIAWKAAKRFHTRAHNQSLK